MHQPGIDTRQPPAAPRALLLVTAVLVSWVAAGVAARSIAPAIAGGWMPRWDLAEHLMAGWTDAHYLRTGALGSLIGHLWGQGYWPPGPSVFQVPFHLVLGGDPSTGLYSSLVAFVLSGLCAVSLLGRAWGREAWLSSAVVLLLMTTSPFFLAYAALAMSEMPGVLAQAAVLVCHARYLQRRDEAAARWFALSLTALFFTKYNYFLLLVVPLVVHEWLEATAGRGWAARLDQLRGAAATLLSTTPARLAAAGVGLAAIVEGTGGVAFEIGGRTVAVRTVGYLLHPVLYGGLAWLWWRYRQGRIDWAGVRALDPRAGPLLAWFVAPVTVWLASPYPNHLKDVVNLVVNIPLGPPSPRLGLSEYLEAIRADYFLHPGILAVAAAAFVLAVVRYRAQPPLVRLLVLAAVLQFAMVALHHTRDARFVLLAMPLVWLVSAGELAAWVPGRALRVAATCGVMAAAVAGTSAALASPAFVRLSAAHYSKSPGLAGVFDAVRGEAGPGQRVAVVGRADVVSPALVRWQLGPARGFERFPDEIDRVADLEVLETADFVLVVAELSTPAMPAGVSAALRARLASSPPAAGRQAVVDRQLDDLGIAMRLLRRAPLIAGLSPACRDCPTRGTRPSPSR